MRPILRRDALLVLDDRVLHVRWPGWGRPPSLRLCVEDAPGGDATARFERCLERVGTIGDPDVVLGSGIAPALLVTAADDAAVWPGAGAGIDESLARELRRLLGGADEGVVAAACALPCASIVFATRQDAIDRICAALARHGLRPRSVQPLLGWLTGLGSAGFGRPDGWTLLAEPGNLTAIHFSAGAPDLIRRFAGQHSATEAATLLMRAAAAAAAGPGPAETLAIGRPALSLQWPAGSPWPPATPGRVLLAADA